MHVGAPCVAIIYGNGKLARLLVSNDSSVACEPTEIAEIAALRRFEHHVSAELFALVERKSAPHQPEIWVEVAIVRGFDLIRPFKNVDRFERDAAFDAKLSGLSINDHSDRA